MSFGDRSWTNPSHYIYHSPKLLLADLLGIIPVLNLITSATKYSTEVY